LQRWSGDDANPAPEERHRELVAALGPPPFAAGLGYYRAELIAAGEEPEERGIVGATLLRTPD
jgi:hypothetical protein